MKKYEYAMLNSHPNSEFYEFNTQNTGDTFEKTEDGLLGVLNELGEEGWALINHSEREWILRREKSEIAANPDIESNQEEKAFIIQKIDTDLFHGFYSGTRAGAEKAADELQEGPMNIIEFPDRGSALHYALNHAYATKTLSDNMTFLASFEEIEEIDGALPYEKQWAIIYDRKGVLIPHILHGTRFEILRKKREVDNVEMDVFHQFETFDSKEEALETFISRDLPGARLLKALKELN